MNPKKHEPGSGDIGCLESIETLYAWLDGEVEDRSSIGKLEHHLSHCRSCYSRAEMERALTEHVRKSARSSAPDSLKSRLRDLLDEL